MDEEALPICNSTKPNLQLQLQQPSKYSLSDDIEAAKHLSPHSECNDVDAKEIEDGVEKPDEEKGDQSAQAKVPLLYQVEPGCTTMSCYASIITFFIMLIGVLALLMISPPFSQVNKESSGPKFDELLAKTLSGQIFYKNGKMYDTIDVVMGTDPPPSTLHPGNLVVAD